MTFGQKFKMLMVANKLTYEKFAAAFGGIKRATAYRWAGNKSWPDQRQLTRLAEHFGVPVAYLADDRFDTVEQANAGLSPEEARYVEMGRAFGMKDAARLVGLVEVLVKEQSLQEVYRRLLKIEPGQEIPSTGGDPGPGNPGVGSRPANLDVHAAGKGTTKGVGNHKPKPGHH